MKNIVGALLLIVFSFSSFNFAQSILHPNKFGLAFHYGYASTQNNNIQSATILVSPSGPLDLFFSLAGREKISSKQNQISVGFSYYINNDVNKPVVPALTLSFSYSNSEKVSALGLGAGLNINAYRVKNFSFIPAISIGVLYKTDEGNSYSYYSRGTSAALVDYHVAFSLGFAGHIDDIFIISLSPGIAYAGDDIILAVTTGLALTPF